MNSLEQKDLANIKRQVALLNMLPNVFWTVLGVAPIFIFCYQFVALRLIYVFIGVSLLALFLPKSFFDQFQLGQTSSIYKKIGVTFINKFIQNGDFINSFIRKKFPNYKVISSHKKAIQQLIQQTYYYEKFHFMMLLFYVIVAGYAIYLQAFGWAFVIMLTNVLYNVYPNFLQQYLRIRLKILVRK